MTSSGEPMLVDSDDSSKPSAPVQTFYSEEGGYRRRRYNVSLFIGSAITACFLVVAFVSVFYLPGQPNLPDILHRLLPPGSPGHFLGTDNLGRDVLSQIMSGAKTSVTIGALGSFGGLIVGLVGGLAGSGYGRWADEGVMRFADMLLAFPGIITALVLATSIGSGPITTVVALILFFSPSFARVIRSAALGILAEDFVEQARLYGRSRLFILCRHVVPNLVSVLIVQFTLYFAVGILVEAALSFLGVGVARPTISWGLMLNEAQQEVGASSLLAIWPGLAIVIAVLGLNLLGDGLRDVLDPRMSGQGDSR